MRRASLAPLALMAALCACSESEAPAEEHKEPRPALVELAAVEAGALEEDWTFLGRVEPAHEAELAAAVAGHVEKVTVREGDEAERGALLLSLDASDARAQVASARAKVKGTETELAQARRQLQRVEKLGFPTVSKPEQERFQVAVETLEARLATERADAKRAQVALAHHTIRAPFSGVVKERHVDPGGWVDSGQPVLSLVSLDELEIHVDVTAELGSRLQKGQAAVLIGRGRAPATIAGLVPALDAQTRTMRVRLVPEERPPWLLAGMAVDVEFEVSFGGDGVTVPRDALVRGPVETRVVVFREGKGMPVTVKVLATAETSALVRGEGLKAGDKVVVRGNERLRPGQPLRVVGESEESQDEPPGG